MNFNDNYKYAVVYQRDCDTAIRSFNKYSAAYDFARDEACKFSRSGEAIEIFEQRAKGHWQLVYSFERDYTNSQVAWECWYHVING